jgi:hypothetical protein
MKKLNIRMVCALILLYSCFFAISQIPISDLQFKNTDSLYFKSESLFKCNIKFPKNYNPANKYTLVIGLHGGGGTPESSIKVWDNLENVGFI